VATHRVLRKAFRNTTSVVTESQRILQRSLFNLAQQERITREKATVKAALAKIERLDAKLAMVDQRSWSSWFGKLMVMVERAEWNAVDLDSIVRVERVTEAGR
jgi:hypothetical protein